MRNRCLELLLIVFPFFASAQTHSHTIFFATASDTLSAADKDSLRVFFEGQPVKSVSITGYTDSRGSESYNQELAKRRALAVFVNCQALGVDTDVMTWDFQATVEQEGEKGLQQNRRVEIEWMYALPVVTDLGTKVESGDSIETISIDNSVLLTTFQQQVPQQQFHINPQQDTTLITRDGLQFVFPANILALNGQPCQEPVTINITEYNDLKNMILGNMTTVSDGKLLYSVGMYDIDATVDGQAVAVAEGKAYQVRVPDNLVEEEAGEVMDFEGEVDEATGAVNWVGATQLTTEIDTTSARPGNRAFYRDQIKANKKEIREDAKIRRLDRRTAWRAAKQNDFRSVPGDRVRTIPSGDTIFSGTKRYRKKCVRWELNSRDLVKYSYTIFEDSATWKAYHVLRSTSFSLKNCDVFWVVPDSEKVICRLQLEVDDPSFIRLAFQNRRTMVDPINIKANFAEFRVPSGEKVWAVAIKVTEAGQYFLGLKELITRQGKFTIELEEMPGIEAIVEELERID